MINYKLEGLNKISLDVYVLPLVEPNFASRKCMHVVDLDYVSDSQRTLEYLVEEVEIQVLTLLDDSDQLLPPPLGSRVSGESIDHVAFDLKSTLLSAKVMARYWLAKEKFRKDVKVRILEDHQWHLRSLDKNLWV
jgi:hypothetical protein